jgi:hypothetical protein
MLDWGRRLRVAVASTAWLAAAGLAQPALAARQDFSSTHPSADAQRLVEWVRHTGDAHGRPFAVVDKRDARIFVIGADGRLAGQSAAILGSAIGDHIAPGVGEHAQTGHVPAAERTTPAGRFEAEPGENASGERIVWVDYASAFAIHRLRPGASYKLRASRLATGSSAGKRLSWGCVVVPRDFYQGVVAQVLGRTRSVVYVLPETRPLGAFFGALDAS